MMRNIGSPDRIIRILIAVVITILYFTKAISGTAGLILLVLAGVLAVTALLGVCPLYMLFGLRTNRSGK